MARPAVRALSLAVMLIASLPSGAAASGETATLHAGFSPHRLGAGTTISFGFHLATSEGLAPPPLSQLRLRMPAGINYTTTTLGLAVCQPAAPLAHGLRGCSPNSRLGYGRALVEAALRARSRP